MSVMTVFILRDERGKTHHHVLVSESNPMPPTAYARVRGEITLKEAMEKAFGLHRARLMIFGKTATPVTSVTTYNEFMPWCFTLPSLRRYSKVE